MRLLIALVFLTAFVHAAEEAIALPFAGSRSTYWNDFPREAANGVERKLRGHVGARVIPEIVGRSGSDIRECDGHSARGRPAVFRLPARRHAGIGASGNPALLRYP